MRRRWFDACWLLAVGLVTSAWCLSAAAELSATFDEPLYIKAGLHARRTGSNKPLMSAGTMTLPIDVQTLPIYVWERVRGVPFDWAADLDRILPVARAANLVFWWLLLAYAMRLGRTFGGAWGGRLAVGFVGFDPNLLGHACLATTDIAVTACLAALVYHAYHGQGRGWGRRVGVPALWYGLATTAKASGMVFGAQLLLVLGVCQLAKSGAFAGGVSHLWRTSRPLRKDVIATVLLGLAFAFAYTGSDWGTEWTFVDWAEKLPSGTLQDVMLPVSRNLAVFPNAGEALSQQIKHNLRGHGTYLMGEWHQRATWPYFPLALSMKVPAASLAFVLGVLVLRPRDFFTPVGWCVLLLFAFSLTCRVQIGIRFMFPLMTLAYVAASAAAARSWQSGRPVPRSFVAGCLVGLVAAAGTAWPDGLAYFNRLWGGPARGHEYLHDSNTDWGQGLPALRAWHVANGEPPTAVWYYGTDPGVFRLPVRFCPLHTVKIESGDDVKAHAGKCYLAVSATLLYGDPGMTPGWRAAAAWLRTQTPVARAGPFFLFDLR